MRWSFFPDREEERVRKPYEKRRKPSWRAPEHSRLTSDMWKGKYRNEKGEEIGEEKYLWVDRRPTILQPERPTRPGWL